MPEPGPRAMHRLAGAFGHAFRGLAAALRHELAFRIEVATAAVAVPVAIWLGGSGVERAVLVAVVLLVPLVELVNGAIEAAVDRAGTERHPLARRAKDMGAAALLVALVLAAGVWLLVLLG